MLNELIDTDGLNEIKERLKLHRNKLKDRLKLQQNIDACQTEPIDDNYFISEEPIEPKDQTNTQSILTLQKPITDPLSSLTSSIKGIIKKLRELTTPSPSNSVSSATIEETHTYIKVCRTQIIDAHKHYDQENERYAIATNTNSNIARELEKLNSTCNVLEEFFAHISNDANTTNSESRMDAATHTEKKISIKEVAARICNEEINRFLDGTARYFAKQTHSNKTPDGVIKLRRLKLEQQNDDDHVTVLQSRIDAINERPKKSHSRSEATKRFYNIFKFNTKIGGVNSILDATDSVREFHDTQKDAQRKVLLYLRDITACNDSMWKRQTFGKHRFPDGVMNIRNDLHILKIDNSNTLRLDDYTKLIKKVANIVKNRGSSFGRTKPTQNLYDIIGMINLKDPDSCSIALKKLQIFCESNKLETPNVNSSAPNSYAAKSHEKIPYHQTDANQLNINVHSGFFSAKKELKDADNSQYIPDSSDSDSDASNASLADSDSENGGMRSFASSSSIDTSPPSPPPSPSTNSAHEFEMESLYEQPQQETDNNLTPDDAQTPDDKQTIYGRIPTLDDDESNTDEDGRRAIGTVTLFYHPSPTDDHNQNTSNPAPIDNAELSASADDDELEFYKPRDDNWW